MQNMLWWVVSRALVKYLSWKVGDFYNQNRSKTPASFHFLCKSYPIKVARYFACGFVPMLAWVVVWNALLRFAHGTRKWNRAKVKLRFFGNFLNFTPCWSPQWQQNIAAMKVFERHLKFHHWWKFGASSYWPSGDMRVRIMLWNQA